MVSLGRYVDIKLRASFSWPLWITPRLAVAVNLAQLVALPSHSKFSLQKNYRNMEREVSDWLRILRLHEVLFKSCRMIPWMTRKSKAQVKIKTHFQALAGVKRVSMISRCWRDREKFISMTRQKKYREGTNLRKESQVVPQCMKELAITVALWHTEFLTASCNQKKKLHTSWWTTLYYKSIPLI